MPGTADILRTAAHHINAAGLNTGNQFIDPTTRSIDISAAIYVAAEVTCPNEFHTDELTSLEIIAASAPAMTAIRALSDSLDTGPCFTVIAPGHEVPDYIEHVSNWSATTPVFGDRPPNAAEVIGALLRAANLADTTSAVPQQRAA
ncbi:DUF6197 family protein [Streptomyces halstedii]|uniref:DUF6197 family protein n=1 Tax=Streptomyces halstedii TaxID=1944 RepID=UPI003460AA76